MHLLLFIFIRTRIIVKEIRWMRTTDFAFYNENKTSSCWNIYPNGFSGSFFKNVISSAVPELKFYGSIPSHKQFLPGAVVGVLHVGDADGGVADPVVHHRVHRDRHAVLGQHLASYDQWPMVSRLRWVSPPAVELQVWLSSGQPSRTTRCRGEQRKFLEN